MHPIADPDHFITKCSCGVVLAHCGCVAFYPKKVTVVKDGCPRCKARVVQHALDRLKKANPHV